MSSVFFASFVFRNLELSPTNKTLKPSQKVEKPGPLPPFMAKPTVSGHCTGS
jgi:hypothetical protein